MCNSTLILQDAEFNKNDKFSMDFANCKMLSEFIILHFAETAALPHSDKFLQFMRNSAKCRIMNSDDILQFAKSIENLLFLINSAFCKIKVELYIQIRF